jgi:uncharacterized alpha-E superfamily protein
MSMLSRVADGMYWIGRYMERAEHSCRLLSIGLDCANEAGRAQAGGAAARAIMAVSFAPVDVAQALWHAEELTFGRVEANSVLYALGAARENARQIRDQISSETWETLNRLHLRDGRADELEVWRREPARFYERAISDCRLFDGFMDTTMSHGEGWRWLKLGRHIERAQLMSRLIELHLAPGAGAPGVGMAGVGLAGIGEQAAVAPAIDEYARIVLLRLSCALEPFLRAYTSDFKQELVAEFLVFDPDFPRSVRFAARAIDEHVRHVGRGAPEVRVASCLKRAGRLRARLDYGSVEDVLARDGHAFLAAIAADCAAINDAVGETFVRYPLEERLPA